MSVSIPNVTQKFDFQTSQIFQVGAPQIAIISNSRPVQLAPPIRLASIQNQFSNQDGYINNRVQNLVLNNQGTLDNRNRNLEEHSAIEMEAIVTYIPNGLEKKIDDIQKSRALTVDDILYQIFSFIQNPATVSTVSKSWRTSEENRLKQIWESLLLQNHSPYCRNIAKLINRYIISNSSKWSWFSSECSHACSDVKKSDVLTNRIFSIESTIYNYSLKVAWNAIRNQLHLQTPQPETESQIQHEIDFIAETTEIDVLRLNWLHLPIFPKELCILNVKNIDLSCNRLYYLPKEFGQFKNLRSLSLTANCRPIELPQSFSQLISLRQLMLERNGYHHMPPVIFEMPWLTVVNFSQNYLTEVPPAINHLEMLSVLSLTNNQINSIPDTIMQLLQLWNLDLSSNPISQVPKTFPQFVRRLQCFRCDETPLAGYSCTIL